MRFILPIYICPTFRLLNEELWQALQRDVHLIAWQNRKPAPLAAAVVGAVSAPREAAEPVALTLHSTQGY